MTRRSTGRALILGLLIVVAMPATSSASPVAVGVLAVPPTFGPFLGGDGVVWVQTRSDHAAADVMTEAAGAAARAIGAIPLRPGATTDGFQVEVSGGYLGYSYDAVNYVGKNDDPVFQYSEVAAGPLAGPYERLAYCAGYGGNDRFSLSAGVIAYTAACTPSPPLEIADLATGSRQAFTPAPLTDFQLAGNFLAFRTSAAPAVASVYDRTSGALVYQAGPLVPSAPVQVAGYGLQADGKVAASLQGNPTPQTRASVIAWFSPADALAHVLPQPQVAPSVSPANSVLPVRIAADTIVYPRPESPCNYNGFTDLVESDLLGDVRLIDRIAVDSLLPLGLGGQTAVSGPLQFDFDGQTVAWVGNRTGAPTIYTQNLVTDVPPLTPAEPANCPVVLAPAARVVDRAIRVLPTGRSAHLLIACLNPAQPGQRSSGCALKVDVRSAHPVRLTPRSRPALVQFAHGSTLDLIPIDALPLLPSGTLPPSQPIAVDVPAGVTGTLPIVLDARRRGLLARVRRLALSVTLTDYFTHVVIARTEVTLLARR